MDGCVCVTEYDYIIQIEQLMCSKQMQMHIQIGGALFVVLFYFLDRKVESITQQKIHGVLHLVLAKRLKSVVF